MTNINNLKILGSLPRIYSNYIDTPIINSNLFVWLKSTNGVTYDGSNLISNWANQQSELNTDFAQTTASLKPTYQSTNAQFNNLPALNFNAAGDDYLQCPSTNAKWNFSSTGFTIYIVAKINSFLNTFNMLFQHSNGSTWTQGVGILYYTTDNGYRFFINNWNTAASYILLTNTNTTTAQIFKFKWNLTTMSAQIFGSSPSNNSKAYSTAYSNPTGNTPYLCYGGATIYDFSANLGEMLIYNTGNLTNAQETQIETYLKNRYAIV